MATAKDRLHLLSLPLELRRQIIIETLLAEIYRRPFHPFGLRAVPFDRPIFAGMSRSGIETMERQHWHCPAFWGKEPMTRLMRVNKQLYEEVYYIMWAELTHHFAGPRLPDSFKYWLKWLRVHNPRAIQLVRHLHLEFADIFQFPTEDIEASDRAARTKRTLREIQDRIKVYPSVVSVRFQVYLVGSGRTVSQTVKANVVERIMGAVNLCNHLKVMVLWVPDRELPWGEEVVRECQDRIGQVVRMPPLYRDFFEDSKS